MHCPKHRVAEIELLWSAFLQMASIQTRRGAIAPPLFRTTRGRTGLLTNRRKHRVDAWRTVRRRAAEAGIRMTVANHTLRATGITNYMINGGDLK